MAKTLTAYSLMLALKIVEYGLQSLRRMRLFLTLFLISVSGLASPHDSEPKVTSRGSNTREWALTAKSACEHFAEFICASSEAFWGEYFDRDENIPPPTPHRLVQSAVQRAIEAAGGLPAGFSVTETDKELEKRWTQFLRFGRSVEKETLRQVGVTSKQIYHFLEKLKDSVDQESRKVGVSDTVRQAMKKALEEAKISIDFGYSKAVANYLEKKVPEDVAHLMAFQQVQQNCGSKWDRPHFAMDGGELVICPATWAAGFDFTTSEVSADGMPAVLLPLATALSHELGHLLDTKWFPVAVNERLLAGMHAQIAPQKLPTQFINESIADAYGLAGLRWALKANVEPTRDSPAAAAVLLRRSLGMFCNVKSGDAYRDIDKYLKEHPGVFSPTAHPPGYLRLDVIGKDPYVRERLHCDEKG